MLKGLGDYFEGIDNQSLLLILIFLTITLGVLDYFSGPELAFSFIYIMPIMIAVWYGGYRPGLVISFVSIAIWLSAELAITRDYSHPLILVWNTLIRLAFFLLVMRLLLSVREKVATLTTLASVDPLTGLANRRFFLEQLERERARASRYPVTFTVAYIDLDNFKYVNDSFGHTIGDELLQVVGNTIQLNLRESDLSARLGGDEFVIFFPALEETPAKKVIDGIQKQLKSAMDENSWPVTFSIGMVTYNKPMKNIREMVHKADEIMYQVKKSGKDNTLHIVWPAESNINEVTEFNIPNRNLLGQ